MSGSAPTLKVMPKNALSLRSVPGVCSLMNATPASGLGGFVKHPTNPRSEITPSNRKGAARMKGSINASLKSILEIHRSICVIRPASNGESYESWTLDGGRHRGFHSGSNDRVLRKKVISAEHFLTEKKVSVINLE